MVKYTFDKLKNEYKADYEEFSIIPSRLHVVQKTAGAIKSNYDSYCSVSEKTGVPWYVIGIIHVMEAGGDFTKHLHNGDSLKARTVHVPSGRPLRGNPPFKWEDSAVDALEMHDLHNVKDWSAERCLYELERYNGFGPRMRGKKTAYLWSFTDKYDGGKFVRDGVWDANAVSGQVGAAALLKLLTEDNQITDTQQDAPKEEKHTGIKVSVGTIVTALGAGLVQSINNPYALVFMLAVLGLVGYFGYKWAKIVKRYITATE